jgi:hypothetical protein
MTDGTGSMASLVLTRQAGGWRDRASATLGRNSYIRLARV